MNTLWEPSHFDYYPDTVESYYALGEGRYAMVQVERTTAGWHGLLFTYEDVSDEDDVPMLYDDVDPDNDSTFMFALLDEAVFQTEQEAKDWCEDHNASEAEV